MTKDARRMNIYSWLYGVCLSINTNDQASTTGALISIAKRNEYISVTQYYDLYVVLYEKIICGTGGR